MSCNGCALGNRCPNPLQMGNGKKTARIMVVQENPYKNENLRGQYMGGGAGKLFRSALSEVGIDLDDVYFTAVVKCTTPEDRMPLPDEAKACQDYLWAEIDIVKPEIIVPTGNISLKLLMNETGITKHRGKVITKDGQKYLPIIHPNLVLKQPKYMEWFTEDMITLESTLNGSSVIGRPTMKKERRYCETYEDAIDELNRLLALPSGSNIVLDLETVKTNPFLEETEISEKMKALHPNGHLVRIVAIGFSDRAGYGCAIPLYHEENKMPGNQIGTVIKTVRQLLERDDLFFSGQNSKFEIKWLRRQLDIWMSTMVRDTMLQHYLAVTEEKGTHGLDDLAWVYTDMGGYDAPLNAVKPTGVDEGNYGLIPWDILKVYLADDCDCTSRAIDIFTPMIESDSELKWIWDNLMVPGYYTLCDIESNGMYVDKNWLAILEEQFPKELARINDKLHQFPEVLQVEREFKERWDERCAIGRIQKSNRTEEQQWKFEKYKKYDPSKEGSEFNFGSSKQLQDLLFNRMGLTTIVLTEKGEEARRLGEELSWEHYSTKDESLIYMQKQHPMMTILMEFRKVNHLYNNFVVAIRQMIDKDGLIHPNYNLHGTVTGRLSSDDPNAQQFPRKVNDPFLFQYWHEIKTMFTSRFGDDGVILQFDYSQLELRILAVFSQDDNLIELYRSGADLHKAIASLAFGVPIEQVTKDQRTASKKLQFGIVYQESPQGLSDDLASEGITMSVDECKTFIDNYFARFPRVKRWVADIKKFAKRNKYVKTLTGRTRHLPAIDSTEKSIASEAERQAVNAPIQSTGSDCTLMSLIMINKWLKETDKRSKLFVTVHDSIGLDCPKDEVVEVSLKVKHIMENLAQYNDFYKFLGDVPIVAEMEIGYSYGDSFECKDFDSTIAEIRDHGIDSILQKLLAEKRAKEHKAFKQAEEKGAKIPDFVRGYWQDYLKLQA